MIVFRYDKTFEGLLTALFDAYSRKEFPEKLLAEGEPPPLFATEAHSVATDTAKSGRVWKALHRKVKRDVCGMLMHVWLSELPESDELLFRYMRKVFDSPPSVVTDFADDDVLGVQQIARKVGKERERLIQFARFQKAADDIFFAPVSPIYNVLPLTINFFTDRFADQKWLVYDIKRHYGYYYDLKTAIEVTLDDDTHLLGGKLDADLLAQDEKLFQTMWKSYFKAMTIKERINPRLQRRNLPRRFWKFLPEMD